MSAELHANNAAMGAESQADQYRTLIHAQSGTTICCLSDTGQYSSWKDQWKAEKHVCECMCAGAHTVLGWEGWRFVFLSVALVSILIGLLNWCFAHDPAYSRDGATKLNGAAPLSLRQVWSEMMVVMSVPTFLLIITQVSHLLASL